jgi:hypothetical protein
MMLISGTATATQSDHQSRTLRTAATAPFGDIGSIALEGSDEGHERTDCHGRFDALRFSCQLLILDEPPPLSHELIDRDAMGDVFVDEVHKEGFGGKGQRLMNFDQESRFASKSTVYPVWQSDRTGIHQPPVLGFPCRPSIRNSALNPKASNQCSVGHTNPTLDDL